MSTRPPNMGADVVDVRLSDIPVELRQTVAHELAKSWKVKGLPFLVFLHNATTPEGEKDVVLRVTAEKAQLVLGGKRPKGGLDAALRICPPELV